MVDVSCKCASSGWNCLCNGIDMGQSRAEEIGGQCQTWPKSASQPLKLPHTIGRRYQQLQKNNIVWWIHFNKSINNSTSPQAKTKQRQTMRSTTATKRDYQLEIDEMQKEGEKKDSLGRLGLAFDSTWAAAHHTPVISCWWWFHGDLTIIQRSFKYQKKDGDIVWDSMM